MNHKVQQVLHHFFLSSSPLIVVSFLYFFICFLASSTPVLKNSSSFSPPASTSTPTSISLFCASSSSVSPSSDASSSRSWSILSSSSNYGHEDISVIDDFQREEKKRPYTETDLWIQVALKYEKICARTMKISGRGRGHDVDVRTVNEVVPKSQINKDQQSLSATPEPQAICPTTKLGSGRPDSRPTRQLLSQQQHHQQQQSQYSQPQPQQLQQHQHQPQRQEVAASQSLRPAAGSGVIDGSNRISSYNKPPEPLRPEPTRTSNSITGSTAHRINHSSPVILRPLYGLAKVVRQVGATVRTGIDIDQSDTVLKYVRCFIHQFATVYYHFLNILCYYLLLVGSSSKRLCSSI
jgi:hypothetical protein